MLEPPDLSEGKIARAIGSAYGLDITELTFLPLGNDAATWVYRLSVTAGERFFLKIRAQDGFRVASLVVPHYLREQEIAHVMAPLATASGQQWVRLEGFKLALYSFIEGRAGAHGGMTAAQWREFGALMKQVHDCQMPEVVGRHVRRETYTSGDRALVDRLDEAVSGGQHATEEAREFAAFWREKRATIWAVTTQADVLGAALRAAGAKPVLCHGDMHPWNILIEGDGTWWLVDWDEVVMAPKERDLMFAIGGIGGDGVGEAQTAAFLEGYGAQHVNALGLAYYRAAWAVQDIAAFGRDVLFAPQLGNASRRAALQGFVGLFGEGGIVEKAPAGSDTGSKA